MCEIIQINKDIMGGTPTFRGTRVPIQTLFDYIEGGETIAEFIDDFPTVKKEEIITLLESLKKKKKFFQNPVKHLQSKIKTIPTPHYF